MAHATALSASDQTAIEVSLGRMVGDMFGALATLPLYCLGELPAPDPNQIVLEHYEVWRSCLIVTREIIRSDGSETADFRSSLDAMMTAAGDLRDAYLGLSASGRTDPARALAAYDRLAETYGHIPSLMGDVSRSLEIDHTYLAKPGSIRHSSYERALTSLGAELHSRIASQSRLLAGG